MKWDSLYDKGHRDMAGNLREYKKDRKHEGGKKEHSGAQKGQLEEG